MDKATIRDIEVGGKRVLVRVDFNVPLDGERITDDTRIRAALPTINYLLDHQAKLILCSHLGRPKGKVVASMSLAPAAKRLSELIGRPVEMMPDCIGPEVEARVAAMTPGQVAMLENTRFYNEEEKNDPEFARKLAALADIYVDDAFGSAHRAHASTEGVTKYLPGVAGLLMERELDMLGRMLTGAEHPFVAILGGAKVSDKIGVIDNLMKKVDSLLIGGGMAFTFLHAQGKQIGKSLLDEQVGLAADLMKQAEEKGIRFLLPVDVVVAERIEAGTPHKIVPVDEIPADWMGVDIGPRTMENFQDELKTARTVLWNGPMGVFEIPEFSLGTAAVAKAVGESGALSVVGGGDSVAALEQLDLASRITHISTGGGASLEFLEGKTLPGVACLMDRAALPVP